jgi:transposase, mutator family
VAHKDMKLFAKVFRSIYTAPYEKTALKNMEEADKKWSLHYPTAMRRWYDHWDLITPIFKLSRGIPRFIPRISSKVLTHHTVD